MKKYRIITTAGAILALAVSLQAQPSAHYVPGSEGVKGASLPPPGWYLRDYNLVYYATHLNGPSGQKVPPSNFEALTYANVPRVIWITDTKFLGGYLGVDALVPLLYQHLEAGGYNSGTFGVGDFFAEGTLSWHLKQFDFSVGSGVWAPTGDSPTMPGPSVRPGLGYWSFMQTAGATWFVDSAKTWAVSALNRYEFNTQQRDTHATYGQAYTMEWGVSKTLAKVVDVGAVGYYQQQVTANTGPVASRHDRVAAVGPEVSIAFPKPMLFISCRYDYEFMAEGRAQGQTTTLTVTKRF